MIYNAYIKISNLHYPLYEGDIRIEHPEIGADFVCPSDYAPVYQPDIPEFDPAKQIMIEGPPIQVGDVWMMNLYVRDLTPEEIAAMQKPRVPEQVPQAQPSLNEASATEPVPPTIVVQTI